LASLTPDTTKVKTTVAVLALTNSSLKTLDQLACVHPSRVLDIRALQELLLGQTQRLTWFTYFYRTVLIPQWKTQKWLTQTSDLKFSV
jgi:hypothetical protein